MKTTRVSASGGSAAYFMRVISGRKRGPLAAIMRCGLNCLTPIYRLVIAWRNGRFDRDLDKQTNTLVRRVSKPVVSIGNITTGGTGKTPMVIWIAQYLIAQGRKPGIVSRGYRASTDFEQSHGSPRNDEALEIEHRLPGVPHLQSPNRFSVAQTVIEKNGAEIILLDDGFQHRQLHRDLDIVLIDATEPFGYCRLLPRGLLREPLNNLQRADLIVVTRCDLVSDSDRSAIIQRIQQHNSHAPVVQAQTIATRWIQFDDNQQSLESLADQPIFMFCAIGNPEGFRQTLDQLSMNILDELHFPDHHHFSDTDFTELARRARLAGATALVCTHKDLVKVRSNEISGIPVYSLMIDLEITDGRGDFITALERLQ